MRSILAFFLLIFVSDAVSQPEAIPEPLAPSQSKYELRSNTLQHALETAETLYRFEDGVNEKSRGRAFLQSLLLPGWGQHYADSKTMMKVFIASEVILLGSFVWLNQRANWLEDDFRTFAVTHAGVDLEGKGDRFFVDIGNFNNISEFNQAQLRDRDVNSLYPETEEFFWQWDSEENRLRFDDIRFRSDRARNRSELTLAFILANHLISAIHSSFAVFKYNKRNAEQNVGFEVDYDQRLSGDVFMFSLVKRF